MQAAEHPAFPDLHAQTFATPVPSRTQTDNTSHEDGQAHKFAGKFTPEELRELQETQTTLITACRSLRTLFTRLDKSNNGLAEVRDTARTRFADDIFSRQDAKRELHNEWSLERMIKYSLYINQVLADNNMPTRDVSDIVAQAPSTISLHLNTTLRSAASFLEGVAVGGATPTHHPLGGGALESSLPAISLGDPHMAPVRKDSAQIEGSGTPLHHSTQSNTDKHTPAHGPVDWTRTPPRIKSFGL